jgi:hypothetical protein
VLPTGAVAEVAPPAGSFVVITRLA